MNYFEKDEEFAKKVAEGRAKNARLLGKWVMVMFWLQIAAIIANFLDSDLFAEILPVFSLVGSIAGYVIMIVNSVILIKLKEVEDWFGKAGICYLVSGLGGFFAAFLILGGAPTIASLLVFVLVIVELRGVYDEFTGYEVVLRDVDDNLSEQWALQWKLELACILVAVIAPFVAIIGSLFTLLAVIAIFVAAIGAIVVGIRRLIYMYRTAICFQNYVTTVSPTIVSSDEFEL